MLTRKALRQQATHHLKKHYIIFVALCLIASFIGSEFTTSLNVTKSDNPNINVEDDSTIMEPEDGLIDILSNIAASNLEDARLNAAQKEQHIINQSSQNGSKVFGRTRGVFSSLINSVTSGAFVVRIVSGLQSILHSTNAAVMIMIFLSMALMFFLWFFFTNTFQVISRRMFLEGRNYEKLSVNRSLFLLKVKRWNRAACTMFLTTLYQALWWLTIIGGIIKYFSYFLVPYIVAENPDIKPRQAIRLSRDMMKGHKWQCFLYQLSFIGWHILGFLTFGLSRILFSNPYITAFYTEYYTELRRLAKENHINNADLLDDTYLYEKAERTVLMRAYADAAAAVGTPESTIPELKGIQKFLADIFGITFKNSQYEAIYEEDQARRIRYIQEMDALNGKIYPTKLSPFPPENKRHWINSLHYIRHYSIWSVIMIFFIMAFVGWIWEVSLHLISDGEFVNRGVLHGPWLPIYGTGSILILLLLNKFRKKPALEFFSAIVVCGVVEYYTSYYLEITHNGQKWWDYTGYFLNINGRICAEGLLTFGLGGMLIVYILAPLLDNMLRRIPQKLIVALCAGLLIVYCCDQFYSSKHPNTGKGITDYAQVIQTDEILSGQTETPPDRRTVLAARL